MSQRTSTERIKLHQAARWGRILVIQTLIDGGTSVDARDENLRTPLHQAASGDQSEAIQVLVEQGATVDAPDENQNTPLHEAASQGYSDACQLLIKNGAVVNAPNITQRTPLHQAALKGHTGVIQVLLDNGANVNATDDNYCTPVHEAASEGHSNTLQLLIKKGGTVDRPDKCQRTPLHLAALRGHTSSIQVLIENGAAIDTPDREKWTPLHLSSSQGHPEAIQMLISHGALVDATSEDQRTPLHWAAIGGNAEAIQVLIANKAMLDAQNKVLWTPLHFAAICGHTEAIQILIKNGAMVDALDEAERTPLHQAAQWDQPRAIEMLIDMGATVDAFNENHQTPLHEAASRGSLEAIQMLIKKGATVNTPDEEQRTPLHCAAHRGHTKIIETLIDNGADVDAFDWYQPSPLHEAASMGHSEGIKMLIDKGAIVDAFNQQKQTPLHLAAHRGHSDAIQMLAEEGAAVDARDRDRQTPLHLAASGGHTEAIQMLMKNGASLKARSKDRQTPLHKASRWGFPEAVHLLLSLGASPLVYDKDGLTPLHVAHHQAAHPLMEHIRGFCQCRKQHPMDPSKINAADNLGRTPLDHSPSIEPYIWLQEDKPHPPVALVNVIDSYGAAVVECADGHSFSPVLQLHLDSAEFPEGYAGKGSLLNRLQAHVLRSLLNKPLQCLEHGEPKPFPPNEVLPPTLEKYVDFVFGSALQKNGPNHIFFSWPCSDAHDSTLFDNILSLKGDVVDMCHTLISSPVGKCDMDSEETRLVYSDVELFLNSLSEFFRQSSPLLQFKWKIVGSTAEDTKTGKADEFDILMEFTTLSKYAMLHNGRIIWNDIDPHVSVHTDQCFKDMNSSHGVRVKIFRLICDYIARVPSWGMLSFICLKKVNAGFSTFFQMECKPLVVKLDLIPAMSDSFGLHVFWNDFALHKSFVLMELEQFKSLPPNAQAGYVIAKCVRNMHLLDRLIRKPLVSDLVDRILSSHRLKHALFRAVANEEGLRESLRPHEWAERIYVQMRNDNLRNFFTRNPLFEDNKPYPKQMYLNHYVHKRYGFEPFPSEMKEGDFRRMLINEICQLLQC